MLGRFHEVSIETADIRRSVEFYESLGFTQATTADTWSHPYGVLTDGRLFLGLQQRRMESPTLTFVKAGIAGCLPEFESRGIELTVCHTGDEVFNEIAFRDPFGQTLAVLEARTYSPVTRDPLAESVCGYFEEFSMPVADFEAARQFWEPLGFVATQEADEPYPHLPLTSDHLDIAFHRPRTCDAPMLVFSEADMPARIARLRELGILDNARRAAPEGRGAERRVIRTQSALPRGLDSKANALLEAPEGTMLLLLHAAEG